ncbi:MAG: cytochrome c, partial [Hyphomicrobiales bacterium]|nr:cytochrome c [Hyphomicrobiales bacterium]
MEMMKDIGAQMKTIAGMLKGEIAFSASKATQAAATIAGHAHRITDLFPEGSNHDPSEAAPAIWADWAGFSAKADQLSATAEALRLAASGGSASADLAPAFKDVAATCKGCHET